MYRLQCTLPVWPSGRGREELEPRAMQLVGTCQLVNIGVTVYDALHEACAPRTYACTPIWQFLFTYIGLSPVGCVAQLVERRSLTGELSLSYARPAADG